MLEKVEIAPALLGEVMSGTGSAALGAGVALAAIRRNVQVEFMSLLTGVHMLVDPLSGRLDADTKQQYTAGKHLLARPNLRPRSMHQHVVEFHSK